MKKAGDGNPRPGDLSRGELVRQCNARLHEGWSVLFEFTCAHCCQRCTLHNPNILWDSGFCSRCGQETEIDCGGYTLHQKVFNAAPEPTTETTPAPAAKEKTGNDDIPQTDGSRFVKITGTQLDDIRHRLLSAGLALLLWLNAQEDDNLPPSTRVLRDEPRWRALLESYVRHTLALLEHLDRQCPDSEERPSENIH